MDKVESFLQSDAWGEVQSTYGRKVVRIHTTLAIRHKWYWFIPQGPFVDGLDDGALFVRYEPNVVPTHDRRVADVHPSKTLLTPLTAPEQMLSNMKQKCRYNIHVAEKKQLRVRDDISADVFFNILVETSVRQNIKLHPKRYYDTMIATLKKRDMVRLYGVEYQQEIIAVALVVDYQGITTYLHGGSDHRYRSLMAPYLLHWKILSDAFERQNTHYDWFGLSDQWPGVTKFKLGFSGEVVTRPGTFEHPLRPLWYTGYRMMKKLWI
ncbi:MAG: methicillin resistance protein [uncultured bacterium]|nr:MAG: methicillin resistance protein [uncultured bacterium]